MAKKINLEELADLKDKLFNNDEKYISLENVIRGQEVELRNRAWMLDALKAKKIHTNKAMILEVEALRLQIKIFSRALQNNDGDPIQLQKKIHGCKCAIDIIAKYISIEEKLEKDG